MFIKRGNAYAYFLLGSRIVKKVLWYEGRNAARRRTGNERRGVALTHWGIFTKGQMPPNLVTKQKWYGVHDQIHPTSSSLVRAQDLVIPYTTPIHKFDLHPGSADFDRLKILGNRWSLFDAIERDHAFLVYYMYVHTPPICDDALFGSHTRTPLQLLRF